MKRIICISDTHGRHAEIKLPQGDLLIHAGDASSYGTAKEFSDFAEWLKVQPFKHTIFVAGNHDRFVETNRRDAVAMLGPHVQYLQDESTWWEGYHIYGSPWVPAFMNWAFNYDERQLALVADAIPDDVDILVTHSPAKGVQDTGYRYEDHYGVNIGSQPLWLKLEQMIAVGRAPQYHIFGHNHSQAGVHYVRGYVAINAAQCGPDYTLDNVPIILSL